MEKNISELVDLRKVDALLEGFNKATGLLTAILDLEGNVLSKSGWRQICTDFHRIHPETSKRCTFSDTVLAGKMNKGEKYHAYTCLNGLTDVAVPVEINGQHVANLFSGQFFFEEPDIDFFKKQAKKFDFDEKAYLDALSKVPVVSEEKVKTAMDFLLQMTDLISELGLEKTEQTELNKKLRDSEEKFKAANQQLEANNHELQATQQQLSLANQMLESKNQQLRNILENTRNVHYSHTIDHVITFISPQVEEVLGYTPEEAKINWTELASDNPINKFGYEKTVKAIETGERQPTYELELVRKDGVPVIVEVNESPLVKDGKTVAIVGSLADITERKKAETYLKESEEKFRALYENAPLSYQSLNEDGSFKDVNPTWLSVLGYERDEVTGRYFKDYLHPDYKSHFEKNFTAFKKSGYVHNVQFKIRHKEGHYLDISFEGLVGYNPDGTFRQTYCVFQDITERKQAEEKLRSNHEYLESIFKSAPIGIGTVNNRVVQTVNDKMCDIVGYTKEELHGKEARILYPTEEDFQFVGKEKYNQIKKFGIGTVETQFKRKDGKIIDVLLSSAPINPDKPTENVTFSALDITEKNKAKEKLIEAMEKAQESDRLKSAFLTNMSHEIRTPMNGILGFTDLLKEPQLSGDQKERYLQVIQRSGKRMLDTINDIIDISKIESGQVKVDKSVVSVNRILDEQFSFFQREAKANGLELIYNNALPEEKSHVLTDPHKLEGILINLIKNAIKYTPRGTIEMGCGLEEKKDGKYLTFTVKDTGIGIPSERIDNIFNRFEQADIEDKKAMEGSGLGLAISKSYVEMLGGDIKVKSTLGEGSTFSFTIPYLTQTTVDETEEIPENKDPQSPFKNASVIIAEDDADSQLFLQTILRNNFNKIICTSTGKEAIEALEKNPSTDIILMDIKMPEMNGHDATREIRKFNQDIIIIAQTAYGLSGDKKKSLDAGCDDYISKPIKKANLLRKIEVCLDKKRKQL